MTKDDPSIVNVDLPEKDEILGCTEEQLRKSGFPMEIIIYGLTLKALGTQEQEMFRATQKQDRFAVHINLGERGHIHFYRSPNYYPTRATQRSFHRRESTSRRRRMFYVVRCTGALSPTYLSLSCTSCVRRDIPLREASMLCVDSVALNAPLAYGSAATCYPSHRSLCKQGAPPVRTILILTTQNSSISKSENLD